MRPTGQWYLHLFDSTQPDLDWRNPEVGDMFESVLRFWLDRGVDGFRVDVAHGLLKEASLRDQDVGRRRRPRRPATPSMVERTQVDEPMWDQPEVHDVYRRWHRVLAEYAGDRMDVAEAWTQHPGVDGALRAARRDAAGLQLRAGCSRRGRPQAFADVVTGTFAALDPVGATPDVGAQQPRRRAPRDPLRRRRGRAWPGPGPRR